MKSIAPVASVGAIAGCCALLLALGAAVAMAHGHRDGDSAEGHRGMHGRLGEALGLSDAQKASAEKIHADLRAQVRPLWERHAAAMREIESLLDSGTADAKTIGEKAIAAHAVHQQLKALHDGFADKFNEILTPDQQAKFKEFRAKHEHMHDMHMGPGFEQPGDDD